MADLKAQLIEAFSDAAAADCNAPDQHGGADRDWAYRYADSLVRLLSNLLEHDFSRAEIVTCLMAAENERLAMHGADHPWAEFYADHFLERFAPVAQTDSPHFSLYYYPECPFCQRVLYAIQATGVDVELRHVWDVPEHRDDLLKARGRGTVPVLRISTGGGNDRWLPESADIVAFLKNYAS